MEETVEFCSNHAYRTLGELLLWLRAFDISLVDPRQKAILITELEKVQMTSLRLYKFPDVPAVLEGE